MSSRPQEGSSSRRESTASLIAKAGVSWAVCSYIFALWVSHRQQNHATASAKQSISHLNDAATVRQNVIGVLGGGAPTSAHSSNLDTDASDMTQLESIGSQIVQENRTAIANATTAADIRELLLTHLSTALENPGDMPTNYHDICATTSLGYLNSPSFQRMQGAMPGMCREIAVEIAQWNTDTNVATAVLAAESLHQYCNQAPDRVDPCAIAIAHDRFDLVTQILEERLNTTHEEMACHPEELADAGAAPRQYAIQFQIAEFLMAHPGNLSHLTWTWTQELASAAEFAIRDVRFNFVGTPEAGHSFRRLLEQDAMYVRSLFPSGTSPSAAE